MEEMNTHEEFIRKDDIRASSDRSFGLVFAALFAFLAGWPVVRGHALNRRWAIVLSALFLAAALGRPALLTQLNRAWTLFAKLLHRISTPIIMGLFFFLVITPFGLLLRLRKGDLMRGRFDAAGESYWIDREVMQPEGMTRQY